MGLNSALKKMNEYIVLNEQSMKIYIPMSFFDNNLGEDNGDNIRVFGLLHVETFNKEEKSNGIELLNLPTTINLFPTSTEKTIMNLNGDEPEPVLVCNFLFGDKVMRSSIIRASSEVEKFVNLMIRGKLPKMPYDKILSVWQKNLEINGVGLGVPSSILEMIISEVYRNKEKPEEAFRFKIGKNPKTDLLSYSTAGMREICAKNSTFAALTFEDLDSMIVSSLNRNLYDKEEMVSPIEKIIKY